MAQQRQALATLAERDRLGKELHDGLGQTLGFVSMEAQAARDALSRGQDALADSYLARIVSVTQEAHSDVREFLLGVRTGDTSSLGFFDELEGYLARHRRQHALQVMLDRPSTLTDDAIEPTAQAQLLRIIQEALANVRQHAAATEVRITVACEGDAIHVTIADNGQGFDPAALLDRQDGHYGLRFMQERAEEVGGALQVETAPGRGVKVIVRVPADGRTEGARLMRLLLVDDHPLFLEGLRNLLTGRGYQVVGTARDGYEALAAARDPAARCDPAGSPHAQVRRPDRDRLDQVGAAEPSGWSC